MRDSYLLEGLSPRQREVFRLIARGYTTQESAARLGVSVKTIETHRAHLCRKLQTRRVADLVKLGIRAGLASLATRDETEAAA